MTPPGLVNLGLSIAVLVLAWRAVRRAHLHSHGWVLGTVLVLISIVSVLSSGGLVLDDLGVEVLIVQLATAVIRGSVITLLLGYEYHVWRERGS